MKEKFQDGGFFRLTMDFQVMGAIDEKDFHFNFREGIMRTRGVFPESFNSKGEFYSSLVGGKIEYISRLKITREKNKNNKKDQLN